MGEGGVNTNSIGKVVLAIRYLIPPTLNGENKPRKNMLKRKFRFTL